MFYNTDNKTQLECEFMSINHGEKDLVRVTFILGIKSLAIF